MRKFAIAFLRNANPRLHSHVKGHPASFLLFSTLATPESRYEVASPEDEEVGGSKRSVLPEKREKKTVRLKADKIDCVTRGTEGSSHVEKRAKVKARGRPKASEKEKRKAAADELNHIVAGEKVSGLTETGVINMEELNTEIAVVYANAVTRKSEDIDSHAKADADMTCVHKEFSEFAKKLELNTYTCGRQWEETAHKLLDYGIPLAHVIKMLRKCKKLHCGKHCVDTVQYFTSLGMSHEEMGQAISGWPTILNITNTMFQSKLAYFESVGIDRRTLGKMICDSPLAIVNSLIVLKKHFAFWDEYLRDVEGNAATMISKKPYLLALNLEKTLKPKIVYLEELGIEKRMLLRQSLLLGMSVETLDIKARLLEQFGVSDARKRAIALSVLFGVSVPSLQERFSNLIASGFSLDQLRTILSRCPQVLSLSQDHINLKLTYAFNVMNLSLEALVACPPYWTHSFHKRIKCRYEVIQELRTQGALRKVVTPGYWLCLTDARFTRRFVDKLQDRVKHPDARSV